MENNNMNEIKGAGGKGGGGGRSAAEAPNTLRSSATVRVVEVLSEGEIEGICGGAKGVYLNDTPLQSGDNAYNFPRASWDYRVGLPNQDYMKGFNAVQAEVFVSTPVTTTTPVSKTTSSPTIDAVNVTIQLPQGLYVQDTSNGDLSGSTVSFVIDKKLTSSGAWSNATTYTIDGKTTSPYERQYRIDRPSGSGTWDVRVTRTTADSTLASKKDNTTFSRITEIQEVKDTTTEYNDTAVIGLAIDAETVGNAVPTRAYLVKGIKVQIPSNYDPITRVYSGTWNGTFQTAWTDNPAWVLYDLLTNARYGLGEFISASQVDKYSFYDTAVYNDGSVLDGAGAYEPRFTFNAVIAERNEAYRLLQLVAGSMRASLVYFNGLITILQDRPSSPVKLITKANVINGQFDYKSTGLFERHTAFNVTFNDRTNRHLQKVTTIDASTTTGAMQTALLAAETKYGYNPTDIAAFGATTEGQAIRQGRWALDTELNQTEIATWKMSLNGYDLMPGDVVKLYDEDYTATVGAGRIVSVSGMTVTVDRAVALSSGSTIEVQLADGKTIESKAVSNTGNLSTFTIASGFSQAVLAGADFIVTSASAPRQFKIIGVRQEDSAVVTLEAIYHDPNKYTRVETGVSIPDPVFTDIGGSGGTLVSAPTALVFKETSTTEDNTVLRTLLISWGLPASGVPLSYTLMWRRNNGPWTTVTDLTSMAYELTNVQAGTYDVRVYAVSKTQVQSQPLSGTYVVAGAVGGSTSGLNAVTGLGEKFSGGTVFNSNDLNFKWTNPASNALVTTATLKDFEVVIMETTASTILRTYYEPAVAAGAIQYSTYSYAMNCTDTNNTPIRAIKVQVRCRDTNGNLSPALVVTFSNGAPTGVAGITVVGGMNSVKVTYTASTDNDFKGVLIWGSTTSGFVPSAANLLYDGADNYVSFSSLAASTTYYYRLAAYDSYGKSPTGAGMVVSAEFSATTSVKPGIDGAATLPATSTEGTLFYNTTDGQLYRWHDGAWTAAVPAVNITGELTDAQIAAVAAAKLVGTLTDAQLSAIAAAKITGQLTNAQLADIAAAKITGQLSNAQLSAIAAAKITGQLTNIQLADIAAAKITGQLTDLQLSAISASKLVGTLSDAQLAAISASKITGTLSNAQLAAIDAAKITGQLTNAQVASIDATKITGTIVATTVADGSINTAKFAAGIEPITVVSSVPSVKSTGMIYNTTDAKMYKWNGSAYVATIPASEISGTLTNSQLADIAAAKITGTIVGTQITDGAISTAKIAAGAITASKIAAGTITASEIAALTITGAKIAAGTITGSNLVADTITAGQIAAGAISTSELAAGAVTATNIAAGVITSDKLYASTVMADRIQAVNIATGVITANEIAALTITGAKIAGGTITASNLVAGTITAAEIAASTITGAKIAAGTITGSNIAADTITAGQIAASAITSSELAAGAVTAGKITAGTIVAGDIAAGTITGSNIAALTITGGKLVAGTITAGEIASSTITGAKIAGGTITASNLVAGTITATEIAASTITGAKIAGGTITASNLVAGTITASEIAAGTITGAKIAAGTITGANIAADTITAGQIAALAITSSELAAGAVTAGKITAGAIVAGDIAASTITGAKIATGTITATNIAANSITSNEILANTITGGKIAASTISGSNIAAGTITAANLVANTITGDKIAAGTVSANNINGQNLSIFGGSHTGVGWPASGGGFTLNSNYFLMGNANAGQWVAIYADGSMSMPGMSLSGGVLTINQLNVIDTLQVKGQAINSISAVTNASAWNSYWYGLGYWVGDILSTSLVVAAGAQALAVDISVGSSYRYTGFGNAYASFRFIVDGAVVFEGNAPDLGVGVKNTMYFRHIVVNPTAGTHTASIQFMKILDPGDATDIAANKMFISMNGVKR